MSSTLLVALGTLIIGAGLVTWIVYKMSRPPRA